MNDAKSQNRKQLLSFYDTALQRVNGRHAVAAFLTQRGITQATAVVAIGKAASAMMQGAQQLLANHFHSGLLITKYGHAVPLPNVKIIEAAHPLPDENSLRAGEAVKNFLSNLPTEVELLVLLSGGASSLLEILPAGMQLADLQRINQWLLASGLDINSMNRIRQQFSLCKGGGLLELVGQRKVLQLLVSDVPGDDPARIGSGPFIASEDVAAISLPAELADLKVYRHQRHSVNFPEVETHIVASNRLACEAVCDQVAASGLSACYYHEEPLAGDARQSGHKLAAYLLEAPVGVHVWGGETTVVLPDNPGRGGRNQHMALAMACDLQGREDIVVLVAGTDGTDGPTDEAGALVDGGTLQRAADYERSAIDCLHAADAGTYLAEAGDLLSTGPTGTNVMDMVIAIKTV